MEEEMSERKKIRIYGSTIDALRGYIALGMPLLAEEQALLTRAVKSLSTCPSLLAQKYVREAERMLINN